MKYTEEQKLQITRMNTLAALRKSLSESPRKQKPVKRPYTNEQYDKVRSKKKASRASRKVNRKK